MEKESQSINGILGNQYGENEAPKRSTRPPLHAAPKRQLDKKEMEELLYFQNGGYQRPKKNVHRDNSTGVMGAFGGFGDAN